jgi:hypothetical protein
MYSTSRDRLSAAVLLASPSFAQSLVKDINTIAVNGNGVASTGTLSVVVGSVCYFRRTTGRPGPSSSRPTGPAAGTVLVKDINAGRSHRLRRPDRIRSGVSSSPRPMPRAAPSCGRATARPRARCRSRTSMPRTAGSLPSAFTVIGPIAILCARTRPHDRNGRELWVDGRRPAGTSMCSTSSRMTGRRQRRRERHGQHGRVGYHAVLRARRARTGNTSCGSRTAREPAVSFLEINATGPVVPRQGIVAWGRRSCSGERRPHGRRAVDQRRHACGTICSRTSCPGPRPRAGLFRRTAATASSAPPTARRHRHGREMLRDDGTPAGTT